MLKSSGKRSKFSKGLALPSPFSILHVLGDVLEDSLADNLLGAPVANCCIVDVEGSGHLLFPIVGPQDYLDG